MATMLGCICLPQGARALAAGAGNEMLPHVSKEIAFARLAGQGTYRWFGLKLYDAQLWVGPQGYRPATAATAAAAPFALDLRYARALSGRRIAQASLDEMARLGLGSPQQHEAWLTQMKTLFPDVQEGSRITGVFLPKDGTRFFLDGNILGSVRDAEFARAFFAIWLDPNTSAPGLRDDLLRDAAPQ